MKIEEAKLRPAAVLDKKGFAPKRLSAFSDSNRSEIVYLDVDVLIPYKNQARKIFQNEELEQLAQTIKDHGIRQPLTVIKRQAEDSHFEVISGERRLRAAKMAGLKRVPCIILLDLDKAEEIALIENVQRQDLHPVELANALLELSQRRGWGGQAELATKLGMNASYVSEALKIARLPHSVKSLLSERNVRGRDVLRKVCALTGESEQIQYVEMLLEETRPTNNVTWTQGRAPAVRKESVLRVFMEGDEVSVQSAKLRRLTRGQRMALAQSLEGVLAELRE